MYYLKGCGRCKGDLVFEKDSYGPYYKCLQCGRITEVPAAFEQGKSGRKTAGIVADARRINKIAA